MTNTERTQMNIVIAGHVDHGKSTIIGRLLADTNTLPDGKLEFVKQQCELNSKPFEYAFLLDALKDEQSQGITIDTARVFFKTQNRDYIIIDAPGHIEFLKNMVSGAARAEAALLVIDAEEGIQENSRRHGYMIAMLGVKQIAVLVNKMDLVGYSEKVFNDIVEEYTAFLKNINITAQCFIPVSGREGDGVASLTENISWYKGDTVLDVLDKFQKEKPDIAKPFRLPVQDVYKFTKLGDSRRIVTGTIESGSYKVGDEIVFYPSGKKSIVKSIERFNTDTKTEESVGYATGFTLTEQIYVTRGEIACKNNEKKPLVGRKLKINLFWLGRKPFMKKKDYYLKLGTAKVGCKLEEINRVINASDLSANEKQEYINRHDVAECTIVLNKAIAFDRTEDLPITGRFVIIDEYEIAGGGIVKEAVEDKLSWVRDNVIIRNYKWEKSIISPERRAEKYNQKATMILITGPVKSGKKEVAKELEASLFEDGKIVYFLGIGNVKYGIDADLSWKKQQKADLSRRSEAETEENNHLSKEEHLRRLAEVAHILLDSGAILIVTARELKQDDLEIIKTVVNSDRIETVWVGDDITTDISYDTRIPGIIDVAESVRKIKNNLYDRGIIFKPW